MPNDKTRYLLRRLRLDEIDVEATAGLINRAFSRHEILVGARTSPEGLLEESGTSPEFLQLFDANGALVATAMLRDPVVDDGDTLSGIARSLYIGLAAVEDGFTRVGLGTALVREVERLGRARGYTSVVLGAVREFDLVPYYERRGFEVIHTQVLEADNWSIRLLHHYCEMQRPIVPSFRLAEPYEAGLVAEIVNRAYRVEDFFVNGNRTTETEIAGFIAAGEMVVLIDDDGEIGGAIHTEAHGNRGYFGMLSVDPPRQTSGKGRLMIDMAEQRAIDAGCDVMDLQVVNLREVLPAWYQRIGYVVDGTRPFPEPSKLRIPAHMVTMSKPLSSGSAGKEIWL